MLKRNITFQDFNGTTRTETFYFNLTKAELVEMEVAEKGGLQAAIQRIIASQDKQKLITEFKAIILKSYGEKSEDGLHFIKSSDLSNMFACSAAYDALFLELATDEDAGAVFIKGILPREFVEATERAQQQDKPIGRPNPGPRPLPPQPPTS